MHYAVDVCEKNVGRRIHKRHRLRGRQQIRSALFLSLQHKSRSLKRQVARSLFLIITITYPWFLWDLFP